MKQLLIVLGILFISQSSLAWDVETKIEIDNNKINLTIKNEAPVTVLCDGELFGSLSNNKQVSMKFTELVPSRSEIKLNFTNQKSFKDSWVKIECK